jgi:hypothetical protein
MSYAIFSVDNEKRNKIKEIISDDLISRQSITTRDAKAIKIEKEVQFVLIEGDDKAIEKAKELFQDIGTQIESAEAEEIYEKLKEDEQGAAAGVGFIFGD